MTTEIAQIRAVLSEHQWHHTRDTHCACGFRTPLAQLAVEGYVQHVADLIAGALRARIHEAAETAINSVYGTDDRHAFMGLAIALHALDGTPLPWRDEQAATVVEAREVPQ